MTQQHFGGWVLFVAALGAVLGLLGAEVSQLANWNQAVTTAFVGKAMVHVGAVIGAFVGGKLLPQIGE